MGKAAKRRVDGAAPPLPTPSTPVLASAAPVGIEAVQRRGGLVAALILSVLFAALVSPLWLRRVMPVWDALDYYYPAFTYVFDSLREGRFPLWDPFSGAGEPFHADPQKMVLAPVALLLTRIVSDPYIGFVLLWILHWWWGAMGMVWVSRRFGASAAGALLAGASYALSGFFVSHAEHTTFLFVAAWLPWIIGLADGAVARRSAPLALLAAAALAACAIGAGYPMLVAFTGLAVAVWLALRFVAFRGSGDAAERRVALGWTAGTLALMGAVLTLVWAPVLHAFLTEGAAVTSRLSSISREASINGDPFTIGAALSLLFPFATVHLPLHGIEMGADVSMLNAYMGFAAVPLAATWAWISLRERRNAWLVVFAAFMVLVSLGGVGGIRILLHYVFPPIRYMRFNAPFRVYWMFATCLAAGLGLTWVVRREDARRLFLRLAIGWGGVALAAAAILCVWLDAREVPLREALPSLFLPAAFAGPAVIAAAAWTLRRAAAGVALVALVACLDVAAGVYVNHFTVWEADGGLLALLDTTHQPTTTVLGNPSRRLPKSFSGAFNAHLIRKIPVLNAYTSFVEADVNGALFHSRFVEVLSGPRRFWLAPGGEPIADRKRALDELAQTGGGEPVPAFVDGGGGPRVAPGAFGDVAVESYGPEEIALRVAVPGPRVGLLTSVERYTPAWNVFVDGRPGTVVRTNLFFRGVFLEPGPHRVVWRYEPDLWWPLVGVSAATLALTLLAAGALALRARRQKLAFCDPAGARISTVRAFYATRR